MTVTEVAFAVVLIINVVALIALPYRLGVFTQKILGRLDKLDEKQEDLCVEMRTHVSNGEAHSGARMAVVETECKDLGRRIERLEFANNGKAKV